MKLSRHKSVIERFLLPNPEWQEGYRAFIKNFGNPLGWLYLINESSSNRLIRLDRKGNSSLTSKADEASYISSLENYLEELLEEQQENPEASPRFYRLSSREGEGIFPLKHLGRIKGFIVLSSLTLPQKQIQSFFPLFNYFLQTQVGLAYKTYELDNFYETVHPRALALSTMHSVHRVISASLRLNELLPRIGRLCAQVLKAQGCAIMLMDPDRKHLLPYFSFGEDPRLRRKHRVVLGRGLEGRVAESGTPHFDRRSVVVPFIEEDVIGVISLWHKVDSQSFTQMDMEILKSLSEQAVVAIRNAQLFEETEKLTLGSIQTINELLELHYGGDRGQIPIFGKIVMEVGKDLHLNSRELTHLQRAILLLDAGQLTFSEKVWDKKTKLTKKEFEQIKRIPMRGASLLRSIGSLKPVIPIVLHHHERWDGKGYPRGLKAEEIPIGARIVAVVDSFLAMISPRTYRKKLTVEEALEEIHENSDTQFDPKVVDSFLKVIRRKEMYELALQAAARITSKTTPLSSAALSGGLYGAS